MKQRRFAEMAQMHLVFTFFCCLVLINPINGQDESGFISIDCGLQPENSSYTEGSMGITYVSDSSFTETGISVYVGPEHRAVMQSLTTVRSFPEGTRNCYTLQVNSSTKYLVRASFMYGNYDSRNETPEFDLHFGPNKWDTVKLDSASQIKYKEIIHHIASESSLEVCLVNTGRGTPFISSLEVRPLPDSSYVAESGSLQLFGRLDFGSTTNRTVRYPDDKFDLMWFPFMPEGSKQLSASSSSPSSIISRNRTSNFSIPLVVLRTAATPLEANGTLDFGWVPDDQSNEFYIYLYFAELQELASNQIREFTIFLNGVVFFPQLTLSASRRFILLFNRQPLITETFEFSLQSTQNSTLPPLINAIEVYFANKLPLSPTDQNDVSAIISIRSEYGVKRNWQGDPCVPQDYSWEGVTCSYNSSSSPTIIALSLASAGLMGEIVPQISNLAGLQILDLSNNSLSGPVPAFLARLRFLRLLDLSNNDLAGPIPTELIERSKEGLSLRLNGNARVCLDSICEISGESRKKKKVPSFFIPLMASLAGFVFLVTIAAITLLILMRKKKQSKLKVVRAASNGPSLQRRDTASTRSSMPRIESGLTDYELHETAFESSELEPNRRKFTFAQIVNITNDFERDIGKGGFGRNYLGDLDGNHVTVKLLSSSSPQGYKQLKAEVKHLFRIHHRNLITLFGYCNEGDKMALVYEHMPNGNLKQHISENSLTVFSWEDRLGIGLDVAQGLEYLHTGCRPSIIHRNVKCTNIYLDDKFNAKLGGFGLSRAFDAEEGTHLNTVVAGTPGYVDPEYYISNLLTEKSDVYSFGVVLLEIITGKAAILRTQERMHISQWVESLLPTHNYDEILDPKLSGDYDTNSVSKAIEVAMGCVSGSSRERPMMSSVVMGLKESLAAEVDRKKRLQPVSTDSLEELAMGFSTNPRLR